MTAVSSTYRDYWVHRSRVRGRYADERDQPLTVQDLLMQAIAEGRPLRLDWTGREVVNPLGGEQGVQSVAVASPADQHGYSADEFCADAETEPTTVVREGRSWLDQCGGSWQRSLAG